MLSVRFEVAASAVLRANIRQPSDLLCLSGRAQRILDGHIIVVEVKIQILHPDP